MPTDWNDHTSVKPYLAILIICIVCLGLHLPLLAIILYAESISKEVVDDGQMGAVIVLIPVGFVCMVLLLAAMFMSDIKSGKKARRGSYIILLIFTIPVILYGSLCALLVVAGLYRIISGNING